jgi:hypothetical protein
MNFAGQMLDPQGDVVENESGTAPADSKSDLSEDGNQNGATPKLPTTKPSHGSSRDSASCFRQRKKVLVVLLFLLLAVCAFAVYFFIDGPENLPDILPFSYTGLGLQPPLQIGTHNQILITSRDNDSDITPLRFGECESTRKTYTIFHEGATYIALHFANMNFDEGCTMQVDSANEEQRYVMRGRGRNDRGTFWARHIEGDTVVLKVQCDNEEKKADFEIDDYVAGLKELDMIVGEEMNPERNLRGADLFPLDGRHLSLCDEDDMRNAQCYLGSVEYETSKAVARLLIAGSTLCTGWLVGADNLLLTNEHCFQSKDEALDTDYEFMFEVSGGGDCTTQVGREATSGSVKYDASELLAISKDYDYALVRLIEDPSNPPLSTYG